MKYYGKVFRPPSEARSLIVQATVGCSYNKCDFCSMYKEDVFHLRDLEELKVEVKEYLEERSFYKRVFIADGDALCLSNDKLIDLCDFFAKNMENLERITAYATAKDILRKSDEELKELREHGIEMVYVGYESGSDEILKDVNKNSSAEEYILATKKAKAAGIKVSATIIAGLGGMDKMELNAVETAKVVTGAKPDYISYLTLDLFPDTPLYERYKSGEFKRLSPLDILQEIKIFLEYVDSEGTVFRSNHASNYISLAGNLNEDKKRMIEEIDEALREENYKPEYLRGF